MMRYCYAIALLLCGCTEPNPTYMTGHVGAPIPVADAAVADMAAPAIDAATADMALPPMPDFAMTPDMAEPCGHDGEPCCADMGCIGDWMSCRTKPGVDGLICRPCGHHDETCCPGVTDVGRCVEGFHCQSMAFVCL